MSETLGSTALTRLFVGRTLPDAEAARRRRVALALRRARSRRIGALEHAMYQRAVSSRDERRPDCVGGCLPLSRVLLNVSCTSAAPHWAARSEMQLWLDGQELDGMHVVGRPDDAGLRLPGQRHEPPLACAARAHDAAPRLGELSDIVERWEPLDRRRGGRHGVFATVQLDSPRRSGTAPPTRRASARRSTLRLLAAVVVVTV